ncbi:MAG: hypothetical protein JSS38_00580 [Nitrospira sp.]|nr:hypothetical protein [Nitrospira sp.]
MNPLPAILVYDRDPLFLDALRNFLFTAGFVSVDSTTTVRKTLARLHLTRYRYVLIELTQQVPCERRWATVIQRHQPSAKIIFLIKAADRRLIQPGIYEHIMKEDIYSSLSDVMSQHGFSCHREKADKAGNRKGY